MFLTDDSERQSNENINIMNVNKFTLQMSSLLLLLLELEARGWMIRFTPSYLRVPKEILNADVGYLQGVFRDSPTYLQEILG